MFNCFGCFDAWDDYCWYQCPYSFECEDETYCPCCFGRFDDWDDYCWDVCPYSRSCEKATWGSCNY